MPFLEAKGLEVTFPVRGRNDWPWTRAKQLRAVAGVDLTLEDGQTLGIVGESGSGKSTLARAIIGTVPATAGEVLWQGTNLLDLPPEERRTFSRDVQMVFQDPLAALNPRMTVGEIIAEPLRTHFPKTTRAETREKVQDLMARVGLLPNQINRYPHEFSGGQCQRIGIARALILKPRLLICDEPVSALDVSVQAQVINLLKEIQYEFGLSIIFIAHDLSVVRHVSDRIAVMYLGRIVEEGPGKALIGTPWHPYTQALIASVPVPDPARERGRMRSALTGELPSPISPPSGCVFRTRCPVVRPSCSEIEPDRRHAADRTVACPFAPEEIADFAIAAAR
ncbi:MAG: oligopeptide/dipeptide ABC transporter ATP-binding protein [Pseudomonadota bacterium]